MGRWKIWWVYLRRNWERVAVALECPSKGIILTFIAKNSSRGYTHNSFLIPYCKNLFKVFFFFFKCILINMLLKQYTQISMITHSWSIIKMELKSISLYQVQETAFETNTSELLKQLCIISVYYSMIVNSYPVLRSASKFISIFLGCTHINPKLLYISSNFLIFWLLMVPKMLLDSNFYHTATESETLHAENKLNLQQLTGGEHGPEFRLVNSCGHL